MATAEWDAGEVLEQGVLRDQATPWPRFWAKLVDINVWGIPVALLIGLLFPEFSSRPAFEGAGGSALFGALILPFALSIDAVILSAFGNTPGRALVGIRVETIRHERLDLRTAFKRNARVYFFGMAIGFPLAAMFTYLGNFNKLRNGEQTSWDKQLYTRVYNSGNNSVRTALAAVLALGITIADRTYSAMQDRANRSSLDNPAMVAQSENPTSSRDPIADELKAAAAEIKPQQVDEITRLDRAEADGRVFTYYYTIIRRDASDKQFYDFFKTKVVPGVCSSGDQAKSMKDYGITYRYSYMMPNADSPLLREITWADCQ
jgi:hypothetical protein